MAIARAIFEVEMELKQPLDRNKDSQEISAIDSLLTSMAVQKNEGLLNIARSNSTTDHYVDTNPKDTTIEGTRDVILFLSAFSFLPSHAWITIAKMTLR
jgi:hypothetical protein